ncbi:MAG: hypothetical protein ABI855_06210 [Bacteroidota bacterium]
MWNSDNLNILIGICALIVAVIAFGSEIAEKIKIKIFGRVWFKIIVTVIAFVFGICATIKKDQNSSMELSTRDSTNNFKLQKALSESSSKNIETYTNALAKYHLEYVKSQNRVINLIKDSSSKEIPDFGLLSTKDAINFKYSDNKDTCIGRISFENIGNCPIKVKLQLSVALEKNDSLTIIPYKYNVITDEIYSIDELVNYPIRFYGTAVNGIDNIYILAIGTYKSLKEEREYPIDRLLQWSFISSDWGTPSLISQKNRIRNFFKSEK